MDYDLIPIAMTKVAWGDYIKFIDKYLGYSPTRGLDDAGIKPIEPQAYLATLNLENNPQKAFKDKSLWQHVHCSFAFKCNIFILLKISTTTNLKIMYKDIKFIADTFQKVVIITGSLFDWYNAIIRFCNPKVSLYLRTIFNHMMQYFEQAGFGPIWNEFKKDEMIDGTFVLIKNDST